MPQLHISHKSEKEPVKDLESKKEIKREEIKQKGDTGESLLKSPNRDMALKIPA